MLLADLLGERSPWEALGSDISATVLSAAAAGLYCMERGRLIPRAYLERLCLKGIGAREGFFLVDEPVRRRVRFAQINLNTALPQIGEFDVIFLRNVMIYFELDVKRQVVDRLVERLKPGGWLLIGHPESLNGVNDSLELEAPTIMFAGSGPTLEVGTRNVRMAQLGLAEHGFMVKRHHLAGVGHRNVIFEVWSGDVWLRHVRQSCGSEAGP